MGRMATEPYPEPVAGRIAVVGVCAAGKSVLVRRLQALGLDARCCAQEHSYVPDMWKRLSRPEVLIYLDASWLSLQQRGHGAMPVEHLAEQHRRLEHARAHCQIYVSTDGLTETQVYAHVRGRLAELGLIPGSLT